MPTINATELNYIVYRYLMESGFVHTAFNFRHEARINEEASIDEHSVPPGALVTVVQKGLRYLELEANAKIGNTDVTEVFSFIKPIDLLTMTTDKLKQIVEEKKKHKAAKEAEKQNKGKEIEEDNERVIKDKQKETELDKVNYKLTESATIGDAASSPGLQKGVIGSNLPKKQEPSNTQMQYVNNFLGGGGLLWQDKNFFYVMRILHVKLLPRSPGTPPFDFIPYYRFRPMGYALGSRAMDMPTSSTPRTRGVRSSELLTLIGHTAEVYACAWSPVSLLLASGSEDSTARIWRIADKTNSSSAINRVASMRVLYHSKAKRNEYRTRVTTLDWNLDGTLLATGSNDGSARIWNTEGEQKSILSNHQGPIYSVKWNKMGDYLLTGSFDGSVIAWNVNANDLSQQFKFNPGHPVAIDWRTNRTFAGSADSTIHVCKIGHKEPVKMLSGHKGEINCVQWDPSGSLLASCSDDMTAKVWSLKQEIPIRDFKDHAKEIYAIRWSPTGLETNNSNNHLLLASASSDSTVKLWDVDSGGLFCSLNGHRDAVYCLSFSPNGKYLATGSQDKVMNIWSVKDGKIVKTYFGNGCISGVSWNKDGNKIAYCTHNKNVCVSDFRM